MPLALQLAFTKLSVSISRIQKTIANSLRWLLLFMALCVSLVVFLRLFNIGSTALQESISYTHAFVFMLCLAYTVATDGHVRVDIFYRRMGREQKAWVNLVGSLMFLLPFALFLLFISWQSCVQSWRIGEASLNPGGLPLVFVLKTLPPLAGFLLALQALAECCRQLLNISIAEPEA
ncbi:TRAP transporter small permease subunit [Agaribacterium haliotis]|uniref:TRAP transporter small permease subunit n=1 Tax=Agaribacterium haliotis TaxID=2013869 RepID=UPI001EFC5FF6|nr:TRAP transporter small permease subunit [Agaribacterium haliotis]